MASLFNNQYQAQSQIQQPAIPQMQEQSQAPRQTANSSMGIADTPQSQTGNNQMMQLFGQAMNMSGNNPSTAIKLAQFLAPLYNIDDPTSKQKIPSSISTQLASLDSARGILDEIEGMVPKLGLSDSPFWAASTGGAKSWLGKRGIGGESGEAVKIYDQTREGIAARLARALGETGALTDFDIRRSINLLPNTSDTSSAATEKMARLRRLLDRASQGMYEAGMMSSGSGELNASFLGQ